VRVGSGATTAFWQDSWLPLGTIDRCFSELFSHCISPRVLVASVLLDGGLDRDLVPHLSTTVALQHASLLDILVGVVLT
jgi:hypothetical protein